MNEWKLTSLDQFCLNMVIKGAWIYKEMPDVQALRDSLKKLISLYPHLKGHYQEKGKVLFWDDSLSDEPSIDTCNKPEYSVNDLIGKDQLTWKLVKEYDIKGFKKGQQMPFSASLVNLMGNLSQPFSTRGEFALEMDTVALARAIQQENEAILKSNTQERNLRLSVCASHYGLPYYWMDPCAMFSDKPESLYINNQLKFRACELDFGTGKPLYAFPNTLSDTIKFWQPVAGGPVQIIYWGFMAKLMRK